MVLVLVSTVQLCPLSSIAMHVIVEMMDKVLAIGKSALTASIEMSICSETCQMVTSLAAICSTSLVNTCGRVENVICPSMICIALVGLVS